MRRRAFLAIALALAPATLLAGCVSCPSGPPVTARGIGPGTDARAGLAGFTLAVRVVADDGAPIEGAGVVVYWSGDGVSGWGGDVVLVDERGERVVVVASPGETPRSPAPDRTHRLRTESGGEVVARVPASRVVGVVAAAEGFTEEWIPALATGESSARDAIEVRLYRASLNVTIDGTWGGPGAASTAAATRSAYAWDPAPLPFGEGDAQRGYVQRVASLSARISWTNAPTSIADLGIGMGPSEDDPSFVADDADEAAPGAHEESFSLDADALREIGVLGSGESFIGPASDTGFVAPFGLAYTLEIRADFDTARAFFATCANGVQDSGGLPGASVPGWGSVGAIAAIALVAIVARKPRC